MKLAIDWDGTLWPGIDVWGTAIIGNPDYVTANCTDWNTPAVWMGGVREFKDSFDLSVTPEVMLRFQMLEGAHETVIEQEKRGHILEVLTARDDTVALGAIMAVLDRDGLGHWAVRSCRPENKVQWCLDNDAGLLVEDHPGTLRQAAEAGLPVVAMRYPYNAAVIAEFGIPFGDSWAELRHELARLCPAA